MSQTDTSRRRFCQWACALVVAPAAMAGKDARAGENMGVRIAHKYQDWAGPLGKRCVKCHYFKAGAKPTDKGKCLIIAGDDQISPNGYCALFLAR